MLFKVSNLNRKIIKSMYFLSVAVKQSLKLSHVLERNQKQVLADADNSYIIQFNNIKWDV